MDNQTLPSLKTLVVLVSVLGGCGEKEQVVSCDPMCPAGWSCTPAGCVRDGDGAVTLPDLAGIDGGGCGERCAGATPVCGPAGVCVACLVDGDCPLGSVCRVYSPQLSACLPGCTDDARCGPQGGALRCCGGQCADSATDPRNCGACGTVCAPPHAAASCQAGRCVTSRCDTGWGDCNAQSEDGCEVNLRADARNCGSCGMACVLANGVAGCDNAGCFLAACQFGFDDCNQNPMDGCEVATTTDLRNCGGCGVVCPALPRARTVCAAGACIPSSCDPGYADCDGKPQNGCEVALSSDARNCGACGSACGVNQVCKNGSCTCQQCNIQNARTKCVNLMCVLDSCLPGYADCNGLPQDGCEVDLTGDARNCSACGMACPNNAPFCQGGMCSNITPSCADALRANPAAKSGLYTIDPDGNGGNPSYQAYCEMTLDGGGWTVFFAGLNGSPNVFNHFEDQAVDCNDPAARCMRRLPANVNLGSQFLVTCGNASLRFNVNQSTLNYFQTGVQGNGWMNNANVAAVAGNAGVNFGGQTWTGQANNKGWIISAGDRMQPLTFASSYNLNAQWDYCNGVPDVATPIRLYYR